MLFLARLAQTPGQMPERYDGILRMCHIYHNSCSRVLWDPWSRVSWVGLRYRSDLSATYPGLGSPFQNRVAPSLAAFHLGPDGSICAEALMQTQKCLVALNQEERWNWWVWHRQTGKLFWATEKRLVEGKYLNSLLMVSSLYLEFEVWDVFTSLFEKRQTFHHRSRKKHRRS